MDTMRFKFNVKLKELLKKKRNNCFLIDKERYDKLVKLVSSSKQKSCGKKPEEYHRLQRYDVLDVDGVEKLIYPVKKSNGNIIYYAKVEELFDIIHEAHLSVGHGGRNKMSDELKKKYKNITVEEIMLYLTLCESCQKKPRVIKKGFVKPVDFKEMNSRCQVDLIDMQSQPDDDFKFVFVYQDCLTRFVQLRALKSQTPDEVADKLIDVFTVFGAPSVLQSDSGREFSSRVVKEVCRMWPTLKIIDGAPSQAQNACQDVENMVRSWMETNQTFNWSKGLRFVQLMKNMTYHETIKCTPYEAMFGTRAKIGLNASSHPSDSIKHIKTEEEFEALIQPISNTAESEDYSDVTNDSVNIKTEKEFETSIEPVNNTDSDDYSDETIDFIDVKIENEFEDSL